MDLKPESQEQVQSKSTELESQPENLREPIDTNRPGHTTESGSEDASEGREERTYENFENGLVYMQGVILCFTKLWCHFEFINLERKGHSFCLLWERI